MLHHHFVPFEEDRQYLQYYLTDERLVAPIPDKAEGLAGSFVNAVYHGARKELARTDVLVAIGYSFNVHDGASYDSLLKSMSGKGVVVISPDAETSAAVIQKQYPEIGVTPMPYTFRQWASADFGLPISA